MRPSRRLPGHRILPCLPFRADMLLSGPSPWLASLNNPGTMALNHQAHPSPFSWGRYRIPTEDPLVLRIGEVAVFVRTKQDEIWISHLPAPGDGPSPPPPPDSHEHWERWGASQSPDEVEVLPLFPDRALVLRPENPFHLLPGARARIYVRVPLWIRLSVPGTSGGTILELPTIPLSETWWGDYLEGETSYWLPIRARRSAPRELMTGDRIFCPLALANEAEEELPVEQILLRCRHLAVFRGQESLWSDEVRVRYRGEDVGSELEMTGRTPREAPGAPQLTPPRSPLTRGFTARTFARLRRLPGLGLGF